MFQPASDEPGVAQTLLDIGNATDLGIVGSMDEGAGQVLDGATLVAGSIDTGAIHTGDIHTGETGSIDTGDMHTGDIQTGDIMEGVNMDDEHVIKLEDATEEQKKQVCDDIREKIAMMCSQLEELGEESFLLTYRPSDQIIQHVGSVKGEHFCLLRSEIAIDFSYFCTGKEPELSDEEKEIKVEAEDFLEDELTNKTMDEMNDMNKTLDESTDDDKTMNKMADEKILVETGDGDPDDDDESKHEKMDLTEDRDEPTIVKTIHVKPSPVKNVKPRVIVLKKNHEGKIRTYDHQYLSGTSLSRDAGNQEKENKPATNVLFLCDVCKNVFDNVSTLRAHKKDAHNEVDYPCSKCSRVFTIKKIYEKHMTDAHFDDTRFVCDTCVIEFESSEELKEHIEACHDPTLPMRCDVCEQTFSDIPKLMSHRKEHFDYACFCTKCWQGFFDYLELEIHQQHNCQYKEALYKCQICGKKFTKLNLITKHIDTHPVHSPYTCRMCGRGFDSEKELKNHRVASHVIRPYKCEMCNKTFKRKETLVDHRRIHLRVKLPGTVDKGLVSDLGADGEPDLAEMENDVTEPEFPCSTCGICLSTQMMLDQHLEQHALATITYPCEHCDYVFFSDNLLSVHTLKDHKVVPQIPNLGEDRSGMKVCEWVGCNKTFYDRNKLRQHLRYHEQRADKIARGVSVKEKRTSSKCDVCGKVLKYRSYMKAHMMTHKEELPYQCDQCKQSFPTSKRLDDHLRTHLGEKPFDCPACDKSFTSTALRNQHFNKHLAHKKFICDVCGKGFMSRKHFHDHMRIHAGEQQYRCDVCGKEFIYYRSLVRHSQVHIDPKVRSKPYKCEFCNKEYTEVTGYKHHMRSVHTGENPYQCEFCGEGFHRNDKLKRHLKTRHHMDGMGDLKHQININNLKQSLIVTTRRNPQGGQILVRADQETPTDQDQLLEIVKTTGLEETQNELHVDVIQDGAEPQQVFFIGLGNHENSGNPAYLQETQVIEGPDGVRYIIAGSDQELQVIDSNNLQQLTDGEVVESIQQDGGDDNNVLIMNDGAVLSQDQETLSTLANMASVAEIVQQ